MSREDARMAFGRHATSKISAIDDLDRLATYGFRGEALSSIASVSRTSLRTREHEAEEGTEVRVAGGRVELESSVGCPPGTEVTVDELFYNVPARRKHLKSRAVELAHCREVVVDYMLCRSDVSLAFRSEDNMESVHSAAEGMNGSLAMAFGAKVAENIIPGQIEAEGVRVETHLARLEHTKAAPSDLHIFVNDRPVRSPKVVHAVVKGYGSRLMKDRYPMGVVRIFVEGSSVDVNIHPAKREVKFEHEQSVLSTVQACVERSLESPDLSFRYDLTRFSESFEPSAVIHPVAPAKGAQETLEVDESRTGEEPPVIVPLAQIMNTYILAESRGNLLLVDQHAASERVVYESVLGSLKTGKEVSQRLLTPLVISLTAAEASVLEEHRETLEKAGFVAEPFGKGAFALRSIPTVLGVAQGEAALRNILGDLAHMPSPKKLGLEVIWRVACHTAIRAGEPLSNARMRQLLSELMRTESPYTCEHGRPTMIVLSPADLEKLFKRRV